MAEAKKADTAKQEQQQEKTPSQPAAGAADKKTPEKKAAKKVPGLRVIASKDGFRRGGRDWHGTTDVRRDEFTKEQIKQLLNEPRLAVQEIEIEA